MSAACVDGGAGFGFNDAAATCAGGAFPPTMTTTTTTTPWFSLPETAATAVVVAASLAILQVLVAPHVKRYLELPSVRVGPMEVMRRYFAFSSLELHHECAAKLTGSSNCWTIFLAHDPRVIATVDPRVVRHALITNFANYDKGPQWRANFFDLLGNGIFNADGDSWRKQRKIASHEFSNRSVREFAGEVFRRHGDRLVEAIRRTSKKKNLGEEPVDAQQLFAAYTFASIGEIGFGVDFDQSPENAAAALAFDAATRLSGARFVDPLWRLKRLVGIGSEGELRRAVLRVRSFADDVVQRRTATTSEASFKDRPDVLSLFYSRGVTDPTELRDVVVNFVLAGRDTTACLLAWSVVELARHPHCLEVLRTAASHDAPYVKAFLTEVLRLHPSVPLDFKTANADDVLPGGTQIKRGERLMFVTWSMGRQESIWGPDPERFDPTRHLVDRHDLGGDEPTAVNGGCRAKAFRAPKPDAWPVFHAGPRLCLGKDVAYLSAGLLLTRLVAAFDIQVLKPPESIAYDNGLTLWCRGGVPVKFVPRM